jgi:hypothetical protein
MQVRHSRTGYRSETLEQDTGQAIRNRIYTGQTLRSYICARHSGSGYKFITQHLDTGLVRHSGTEYRTGTQEPDPGKTCRRRMTIRHSGTEYNSDAQMTITVQSLRSRIQGLGHRSDTPGRSYTLEHDTDTWWPDTGQTLRKRIQVRHSGKGYGSDIKGSDTGQRLWSQIQIRHSGRLNMLVIYQYTVL